MKFTNYTNIPLSLAAYLADDTYDHNTDPTVISATSLLNPLKSIILTRTIPIDGETDLASQIASKVGTAIHDGIEDAWKNRPYSALKRLGYPEKVYSNIRINPEVPGMASDINVYLEIRNQKELSNGWIISGKFDFVAEGQLEDFKSKKVWAWIFKTKDDEFEFIAQGSIYRWLNPNIITEDTIAIDYLFTDWKANDAKKDKSYPQSQIIQQKYPLMSLEKTERWLEHRTNEIDKYAGAAQSDMPACTTAELWQKAPVFKFYKDPKKTVRSTKNFPHLSAAQVHQANLGGIGIIKEFKGEVKRCHYCSASPVCQQRESLELSGLLKPL